MSEETKWEVGDVVTPKPRFQKVHGNAIGVVKKVSARNTTDKITWLVYFDENTIGGWHGSGLQKIGHVEVEGE